uniref:Col_cuticle_N domain-containing protein n=1 Tax=Parastrongyloides trichosuri TaxID=131310 RepID=A0A0N4ZU44_PARTI
MPRHCAPFCRGPEKRDFMDINPEKTADDFYKKYDPMIGIGTAVILITFFILITIKSLTKYILRKIKQYNFNQELKAQSKCVKLADDNEIISYEPKSSGGSMMGNGVLEIC